MNSDQLRDDLAKCETVEDMLHLCLTKYDLKIKPGTLVHIALVNGLVKALVMVRPKEKNGIPG